MSVDKDFCICSYLAFRYIEDDEKEFFEGLHHQSIKPIPEEERILVWTSDDIDREIFKQIAQFKDKKKGIMLSGGMDSAIVASYLPGSDAYSFRFNKGTFQSEELARAEYYAKSYGLNLHYVDISFDEIVEYVDAVMKHKGTPVHSIEPQILKAALQAKADGIEMMFIGDGSDYIFGGMDKLLSRDWSFNEFIKRYTYISPETVLQNPVDVNYLFKEYRTGENSIDFLRFLEDIATEESFASYSNAFETAKLEYYDPYARLKMAEPLDLARIRNGEPKYLIRELMKKKYPNIAVPDKVPMPRPVDDYFKDWEGPKRSEFKSDLDMSQFSGNQKWQLWCLERFLNIFENSRKCSWK